jgi:hypothetical protein
VEFPARADAITAAQPVAIGSSAEFNCSTKICNGSAKDSCMPGNLLVDLVVTRIYQEKPDTNKESPLCLPSISP